MARDSEAKGLHEDAVHLYELAKDDAKVIELLCRLLSGSISQPAAIESESWRVQNKALAFAQRLKASGSLLPNIAATFFLLLDLGIFFSLYHEEKYHEAFEVSSQIVISCFVFVSDFSVHCRQLPNSDSSHFLPMKWNPGFQISETWVTTSGEIFQMSC